MRAAAAVLLACAIAAGVALLAPRSGEAEGERKAPPPILFADETGARVDLSAFRGKVVLLNFWASWCRPCRDEMPSLDRLQARLGPRGLVVAPVAIDLKGLPAVDAFYREFAIAHLPKYVDDTRESARAVGLAGVPGTLILDRQGREVFRVEGPLDWDGLAVGMRLDSLLKE